MKKGILFLVLILMSLQLQWVNFSAASELTDDYLDIATNYFESNNYSKSLRYLDLIMQFEPDNLKAKALRDKISPPNVGNSKVLGIAIKALSMTHNPKKLVILETPQVDVEKMSYNSSYYNKKGQEFYNKKEFNTALEYFYKSIKLDKKNAQAYNNLAMSYQQKDNSKYAIKYFKKANSINKKYTQPLVNLALFYKQLGNIKKEVYYLKKAIRYNNGDYLAYFNLGEYYKKNEHYSKAIDNYKKVVKINPKFSPVYLSLAISFFETEEFNYCILTLGQYNEFCPSSDFSFYLMSKVNSALCRYDEAKEYIEKAIKISNKSEYQLELLKIDYYLGDYQIALDIAQKLLQTNSSAELFNYVGLCHYKLKNIKLAIVNLHKAIKLDELRPIYYYNLAQCYKSIGDKRNYIKNINTATSITPINYQDFIDLSYIYYDNGNPHYAINSLNNAIAKYPNVKALYLSKLKIYEALNDSLNYNETKDLINERFNLK